MAIQGGQPARTPEVEQATATPPVLLAKLPVVRHRRWRRTDGEVRSVFQAKAHLVDVIDKPNASFARAIGGIRTELASQGSPNRRVLVVGLRRNAGASTLALNLALDAAQAGLPAMLVDAGLGGNSLTTVFAPDAQAGVHEIVSGSASLIRAALQDEGTGLFFVPRKGHSELVTAEQISHDFFGAARRFGPVFIDGASLGSDAFTQRFADAVDDIVLVVREGEVGAGELQQASTALGKNAAKIRGFVSNEA